MTDVHRLLGSLQQRRAALELDTTALCFLVALRVRAQQKALASFDLETLCDIHVDISQTTEPALTNRRKSATHAIQRLRDQRLLARVDGAGLVHAGDFAMTRLATAIADFFLEDEALTRESLAVLTKALLSQLAEIRGQAERASSGEHWHAVAVALSITVRDLVDGIERRQRGMDAQQQEIRARISSLLGHDWFAAVEDCERLLDDTARTLHELHQVLMQDTGLLRAVLGEIEEIASDAEADEAVEAVHRVTDQVDRVAAWGSSRDAAWSDYYQYVQGYLRSVVRLDPGRAVSQRLQEQLAHYLEQPFFLAVVDAGPTVLLREPDTRPVRPPVTRPRATRDREVALLAPTDPEPDLADLVAEALRNGATRLSHVLQHLLPGVAPDLHFLTAGRTAETVAPAARVPRERAWVPVHEQLEVEDWDLVPTHGPATRKGGRRR